MILRSRSNRCANLIVLFIFLIGFGSFWSYPVSARDELCRSQGNFLNSDELVAVLANATMAGRNQQGDPWREELGQIAGGNVGRTAFFNSSGERFDGDYRISGGEICFRYGTRRNWSCKRIARCADANASYVIVDSAGAHTSVITEVTDSANAGGHTQADSSEEDAETASVSQASAQSGQTDTSHAADIDPAAALQARFSAACRVADADAPGYGGLACPFREFDQCVGSKCLRSGARAALREFGLRAYPGTEETPNRVQEDELVYVLHSDVFSAPCRVRIDTGEKRTRALRLTNAGDGFVRYWDQTEITSVAYDHTRPLGNACPQKVEEWTEVATSDGERGWALAGHDIQRGSGHAEMPELPLWAEHHHQRVVRSTQLEKTLPPAFITTDQLDQLRSGQLGDRCLLNENFYPWQPPFIAPPSNVEVDTETMHHVWFGACPGGQPEGAGQIGWYGQAGDKLALIYFVNIRLRGGLYLHENVSLNVMPGLIDLDIEVTACSRTSNNKRTMVYAVAPSRLETAFAPLTGYVLDTAIKHADQACDLPDAGVERMSVRVFGEGRQAAEKFSVSELIIETNSWRRMRDSPLEARRVSVRRHLAQIGRAHV